MVGKPISGPPNRNDAIYPLEFICRPTQPISVKANNFELGFAII